MAGLLRKALTIRQSEKNRREESQVSPNGLNREEHQQIEAQIEKLFRERQLLPEEFASPKSLKSGALLPVTVNLVVLLALAAGIWFLVIPNWDTETIARSGEELFATTEGFIIEQVREQAAEELSAQERRVEEIRRQLERLREQQNAAPTADGEADGRTEQLEEELNRLLTEMEQQRAQAEQEQGEATSAFEQQLSELQQRQEQQRFVLNQLGFTYETVDRHLASGNSGAAIEELDQADQFLADYSVGEAGNFENTISILQQGNAALREALVLFQEASEVDPQEVAQLARIDRAASLVEEADAALTSGNETEAEELYRSALAEIDPTQRAFQQLEELQTERFSQAQADLRAQLETAQAQASARVAALQRELSAAQNALAEAEQSLTAARSASAAENAEELAVRSQQVDQLQARVNGLESQLEGSRERVALLESRIGSRDQTIESLQAEAREEVAALRLAISRRLGNPNGSDPEELADLLETKTLIREVLSSDVVRRDHPDLYEEMERYLDALGERRVSEGQTQGLLAAVAALQELREGLGIATTSTVPAGATNEELRAALAEELTLLVRVVLQQAR